MTIELTQKEEFKMVNITFEYSMRNSFEEIYNFLILKIMNERRNEFFKSFITCLTD